MVNSILLLLINQVKGAVPAGGVAGGVGVGGGAVVGVSSHARGNCRPFKP